MRFAWKPCCEERRCLRRTLQTTATSLLRAVVAFGMRLEMTVISRRESRLWRKIRDSDPRCRNQPRLSCRKREVLQNSDAAMQRRIDMLPVAGDPVGRE